MGSPRGTPNAWSCLGEVHEEACPAARPLQPARIPRNARLFIINCVLP